LTLFVFENIIRINSDHRECLDVSFWYNLFHEQFALYLCWPKKARCAQIKI